MSSGSLNDLVAALSAAFSKPELSTSALDDFKRALSAYVVKNRRSEADAATRLQDELELLFRTRVQPEPKKLSLFMTVLRHLHPAITSEEHLVTWFNAAVKPFVIQRGTTRASLDDAEHFVVSAMVFDDDAPDLAERIHNCARLANTLLDLYMSFTSVPSVDHPDLPLQLKGHAAQELQKMLVAFGRKKPKELFLAINGYLTIPDNRFQALGLLAAFVEQQQAHLYLVVQTPVVEHLLKCLFYDTATVVVSAALRCLIMLLPHIPATVATQLPRLFLIYSRCLCWEKFSAASTKAQRDLVSDDRVRRGSISDQSEDSFIESDPTWQTLHSLPDMPESSAPDLLHYFTYLYALYPLNFMSYVRKPRKYLKSLDFPGADDFDLDQAVIRGRTEQFQKLHLLHPNFFNTTPEDELSDNRWLKAEPSEVIAECHSLYVGQQSDFTVALPPPTSKLPSLPPLASPETQAQPGQNASANTSPRLTSSPTLPPTNPPGSSSADHSGQAVTDAGSATSSIPLPRDVAHLQRELMSLRNEFTFERYLKQQHVAAIGQLKRNHIKAVTIEAETATLINANRSLQKKFSDAIKFNEKMQKETQARRVHTKQSEEQLTAKIRSLKADLANQESLQRDLKSANLRADQLRQLLVESEAKVKDLEHQLSELNKLEGAPNGSTDTAKVDELRLKISGLEEQIRTQKQHFETTHAEQEIIIQGLEKMLDRSKNAEHDDTAEISAAALEQTRHKLSQSRRAYAQLLDDYTNLKLKYQELTTDMGPARDGRSSIPGQARGPSFALDYRPHDGGNYNSAQARGPYHTERAFEHHDSYDAQLSYQYASALGSVPRQGYSPVRPMRPDAYPQITMTGSPSMRGDNSSQRGIPGWGAAPSVIGSEYSSVAAGDMVRQSSKSAFSMNSEDGHSSNNSKTIKAKSEARVFGRGGAQNIKLKTKDKAEKHSKSGVLKGII